MENKVSSILLAAGKSERMGKMKALLPVGDKLVIEKLIEEYLSSPIDELVVVVGFQGEHLSSVIKSLFTTHKVKVVLNENYESGMYSSVVKGVQETSYPNILLGLVDNVLITSSIITHLLNNYDFEHIIIPSYKNNHGHPVIFPGFVKEAILTYKFPHLKSVFNYFFDKVVYVEAPIEVTIDMDTMEDYERVLKFIEGGKYG